MAKLITRDSLREQILAAGKPLVTEYAIGEQAETGGPGTSFEIPRRADGTLKSLKMTKPVGEFLGSSAMVEELAQVVTVQIESGRDEHPLLYKPIYQTVSNPGLPRLLSSGFQMYADAVWLQHLEGQEVRFGTTRAEMGPTVPIVTYTSGFEWDEDIEVYDEGWRVEMANKAIGDSYNALLNHIHLSPLINFDYATAGNTTAFQTAPSGNPIEAIRITLRLALADAAGKVDGQGRKHPIRPTVALANLATAYKLNDALSVIGDVSAIGAGTNSTDLFLGRQSDTAGPNPSVNQISSIIVYDGDNMQMGNLRWDYGGMADDEVLLIQPKRNAFEYIKHDMRVDTERPADLSRLVVAQMVARTRRGLLAVPESSIWKVALA
jgi:hypothetical protein